MVMPGVSMSRSLDTVSVRKAPKVPAQNKHRPVTVSYVIWQPGAQSALHVGRAAGISAAADFAKRVSLCMRTAAARKPQGAKLLGCSSALLQTVSAQRPKDMGFQTPSNGGAKASRMQ